MCSSMIFICVIESSLQVSILARTYSNNQKTMGQKDDIITLLKPNCCTLCSFLLESKSRLPISEFSGYYCSVFIHSQVIKYLEDENDEMS